MTGSGRSASQTIAASGAGASRNAVEPKRWGTKAITRRAPHRGVQSGALLMSSTRMSCAADARGEAAEDAVHLDLRAASLGILAILPVDDEDLHDSRPRRRASASTTPLTK